MGELLMATSTSTGSSTSERDRWIMRGYNSERRHPGRAVAPASATDQQDDWFAEGVAAARSEAGTSTPKTRTSTKGAKTAPEKTSSKGSKAPAKSTSSSSSKRRQSTLYRQARPVVAAGSDAAAGMIRFAGMTLLVVLLYDALQGADKLSGFLAGPAKAIRWLAAPDRSIPYKE